MNKTLARILSLPIWSSKYRHLVRDSLTYHTPAIWFRSAQVRTFYYRVGNNFGDMLNEQLYDWAQIPYRFAIPFYADFIAIGSILDLFLKHKSRLETRRPLHVFGSGFMKPRNECGREAFFRPMVFHALRGKLSRQRCQDATGQDLSSVPLGDPGLLVKDLFPGFTYNPEGPVGIVHHMNDQGNSLFKNLKFEHTPILDIDICQPVEQVIEQLKQCSLILSSAMHPLICADSFGIPNRRLVATLNTPEHSYKVQDYYSVYSTEPLPPINLQHSVVTDEDIPALKSSYRISRDEVGRITTDLKAALRQLPDYLSQG